MHKLYLLVLLLLLVCSSCNQNNTTENVLKNFDLLTTEDRIWAHKVNTLDGIEKRVSDFRGVEVDIFYNVENNNFEVKHEIDSVGVDLEYYLDSILQVKELYFWFDYKNLKTNTQSGISKLYTILNERELEDKCFVESYFAKELEGFKGKLATSFWFSITNIPELKSERDELYKKKYKYIEGCNIDMLSANFRMFDFITEYFPDYKCNYWIFNKLDTEKTESFNRLIKSPNVNVILIDGNRNVIKE